MKMLDLVIDTSLIDLQGFLFSSYSYHLDHLWHPKHVFPFQGSRLIRDDENLRVSSQDFGDRFQLLSSEDLSQGS